MNFYKLTEQFDYTNEACPTNYKWKYYKWKKNFYSLILITIRKILNLTKTKEKL